MTDENVILTPKQAIAMLSAADEIHTFRCDYGCGMLLGADWSRADLIREIKTKPCELGGERCRAMNYGLVILTGPDRPLFVKCREGFDYESLEKS